MSTKKTKILISNILLIILSFGVVHFSGCKQENSLDVDISDISLNVNIERFDLDFNKILEGNIIENISYLQNEYGDFFEIYNNQIISIGGVENASYKNYVETFLNDYAVTEARKAISKVFYDISDINKDLNLAWRYYHYHFPTKEIPRIISFYAGFNQSIINIDGFIGVGLDKYLGEQHELYEMLSIPSFAKKEMSPERIPFDVLRANAIAEFPYNDSIDNLINRMIYNGIILYYLDACFPKKSDYLKINYTQNQLDYCKHFEKDMWTYLVSNKTLFTTDLLSIRKFTENAPFTSDFGNDSPPRAGNYIGWQIVRSFMEVNKNYNLHDLMQEKDYQKILNLSQYNP